MVLLEIRPGEGGNDAVDFSHQLFEALQMFAKRNNCSINGTRLGRTLVAEISGKSLEWPTGVHRVQRIPKNDSSGRRHTSTATVAVIEQSKTKKVYVNESDIKMQAYRGTGNGGQNRNTRDTAVRLTYVPTGLVVCNEDERTQELNKQKALTRLIQLVQNEANQKEYEKIHSARNQQISSGERSVKEWTWNTQRNEVIDHSTGKRWRLKDALKGKFDTK
jgi:peptide chain release factor 1